MAMTQHEVARTLVKSAPELWEVCSDADSLSRHLHAFGEIRITRVEPETTVAWEGERASGTVRIEPAGWGTRVILTATPVAVAEPEPAMAAAVPAPEPDPPREPDPPLEPEPQPEPMAPPRPGFFRRVGGFLFRSFVTPVELHEEAFGPPPGAEVAPTEPEPEPEPELEAKLEPKPAPAPVSAPVEPARPAPDLDPGTVLAGVLDRLGSDHHRPFSRG
jgi:hypothetical protein